MGTEIFTKNQAREDLLLEIPFLKDIVDSLGTRIKEQGDLLFILEKAIKDVQSYTTSEGQTKLKQETYNYVVSALREEIKEHKNKKIETMGDFIKMLPVKMLKSSSSREKTKGE